jgi:hypothetical protein
MKRNKIKGVKNKAKNLKMMAEAVKKDDDDAERPRLWAAKNEDSMAPHCRQVDGETVSSSSSSSCATREALKVAAQSK